MTIYILNFIMIGIYYIIYRIFKNYNYTTKKVFISLITTQLILVLAFRNYSVGVDIAGYINYFKYILPFYDLNQLMEFRQEIGYTMFVQFIGMFTNNEQIFLTIIAVFSIAPVGIFIYKYSKMPFLSFALYISMNYYSFVFSGLRQAIAYAVVFSSYGFIINKQLFKFVLCVVFASLFHKSALIFLPAYFLAKLKINKFTILGMIIFDGIIFLFRKAIFLVLANTFYDAYELVESSAFTMMFLCLLIVMCGLPFYKRVISVSESNSILYIFIIIGVSLMIFASMGTNVMRVAEYYYMFVIIFIPEVMNAIRNKPIVILSGYILMILMFVVYLWFLYHDGFSIVPYKFFWEV